MKMLLTVTILLIMSGCASKSGVAPSQNEALGSISNSSAGQKQKGWMQRHLDSWLQNDWRKGTEQFEVSGKKAAAQSEKRVREREDQNSSGEEKTFTLQYYVDKIKYYSEHKKKSSAPSHVEEMETMPVIGK